MARNMKGLKSLGLKKMQENGIPVPDFFVVQYGEKIPPVDNNFKYAVRSSPFVSMAGILDSILEVDGENIENAVEKVFASWNSALAVKYRKFKNMPSEIAMEVIIQKIIYPTVDGGFSGIYHTVNPVTGIGDSGSYVDGEFAENLCLGSVEGLDIEILPFPLYLELYSYGYKLENLEGFPQDIEFVYDGTKFWFVQNRPAQLTDIAFFRWAFGQPNVKEVVEKYGKKFNVDNCIELVSADVDPIGRCLGVSGTILEGIVGEDIVILDGGNAKEFSAVQSNENIILRKGNVDNHFAVEARKAKKNCVIWNVPEQFEGKYVWIEIQSGYIFDTKPLNPIFKNNIKNNLNNL